MRRGATPFHWPPAPDWYDQAACQGMGADLFHPPARPGRGRTPKTVATEAKAVCQRCPVRLDCLAEAMSLPWYLDYNSGAIRGGLTAFERRKQPGRKRARLKAVGE